MRISDDAYVPTTGNRQCPVQTAGLLSTRDGASIKRGPGSERNGENKRTLPAFGYHRLVKLYGRRTELPPSMIRLIRSATAECSSLCPSSPGSFE